MVYSTSIKECPKCGKQYNTPKQQEVKNTNYKNIPKLITIIVVSITSLIILLIFLSID